MLKKFDLSRLKQQLKRHYKIGLFVGSILLFVTTPLRDLLNQEILSDWLHQVGIWAVPLYVSTYVLLAILGLPITIHTLAGGFVFGLGWGTVWSTLSATLGAIGSLYVTRYIFKDWAIATFGKHKLLEKLNRELDLNPFNLILALRLTPIAPFNLINFLLALTPVNFKVYTLATFIGVIPGSIAYTWLGAAGKTAIQSGDRLQFIIASSFFVFLTLLPLWFKRGR